MCFLKHVNIYHLETKDTTENIMAKIYNENIYWYDTISKH